MYYFTKIYELYNQNLFILNENTFLASHGKKGMSAENPRFWFYVSLQHAELSKTYA